jgi:hypothetical protein
LGKEVAEMPMVKLMTMLVCGVQQMEMMSMLVLNGASRQQHMHPVLLGYRLDMMGVGGAVMTMVGWIPSNWQISVQLQ